MRIVEISLPTEMAVQTFVESLVELDGDFDLISGNYILDARSMMGIFSLDLSKPVQLKIQIDSARNLDAIKDFIIEKE